jgi:hypothetical protein
VEVMKRKMILILLIILFNCYLTNCADRLILKDVIKDFTFANINGFMKKNDVKKILGNPIKIEPDKEAPKAEFWIYDGIKMYFYGNSMSFIVLFTSKYSTYRGIKVGDKISDLLLTYNKLRKNESDKRYEFVVLFNDRLKDEKLYLIQFQLNFHYADDTITEISSFVEYDERPEPQKTK